MTLAGILLAAYLIGSFPTSYIVVYRLTGRDIRTMGSGNPGAMNVWDSVGFRPFGREVDGFRQDGYSDTVESLALELTAAR